MPSTILIQYSLMRNKERLVIDVDKNRIESLIKWWKETDTQGMDIVKYLINPLVEAFGEDEGEIIACLNEMEVEDLEIISGCFEEIYRKFPSDEMYDALGELEDKMNN